MIKLLIKLLGGYTQREMDFVTNALEQALKNDSRDPETGRYTKA